jgi:hypothetical protein
MSALIPVYALATLLLAPSVEAAFAILLFGLWLGLPLIVTAALVADAKLRRHESFPALTREHRGLLAFLLGIFPAAWALAVALAGRSAGIVALAFVVLESIALGCLASIGVYSEAFGSWRYWMRRDRERRKPNTPSGR